MLDLDSEIAEIRKKLDLSSSDLAKIVSAMNEELAAKVLAAVAATVKATISDNTTKIQKAITGALERDHARRIRLAGLEVAASVSPAHQHSGAEAVSSSDVSSVDPAQDDTPRKSAADLILAKLARSRTSVPTGELDDIVIGEGLSKAASEKAKYLLKKDGYATAEKRRWSITQEGRRKLNGFQANP